MKPRIAITLGDPRGIGPEIVAEVMKTPPPGAEFFVVGPEEATGPGGPGSTRPPWSPAEAGRVAGQAVERAVAMALAGDADAVVTAPVEKRALHLAGYRYPGLTEWLGALAGGVETAMMLVADSLRVVLVTTHIPLRDVPRELTTERIVARGTIAKRGLRERFGIAAPRLALCALNPHAGESGLFGDEDERVLRPAAEQLGAAGPLPADTVFVRCLRGEFDAVLAPYHDVGMTAIKVAAFGRGVNVTLGLPFVRTAPDHGTAFDIAGRGIADAGSMREAVRVAVELVAAGRWAGR